MSTNLTPVPNTWYVNQTGKLVKVRMLSYKNNLPDRVLIEYLEGTTQLIDIRDWTKLDLNRHAWLPENNKLSLNH